MEKYKLGERPYEDILKKYNVTNPLVLVLCDEIYGKAIDDFVKAEDYLMDKIKEETADVNIDFEWRKVVCLDDIRRMLHQGLNEIAGQIKG